MNAILIGFKNINGKLQATFKVADNSQSTTIQCEKILQLLGFKSLNRVIRKSNILIIETRRVVAA